MTLTVQWKVEITSIDPISGMTLGPRVLDAEDEVQARSWFLSAVLLAPRPVMGEPTSIRARLSRRTITPWVELDTRDWLQDGTSKAVPT